MGVIKPLYICLQFITLLLVTTEAFAQHTYILDKTTRFDRMAAEEGLSSGYTLCMHQDKYGFIWIGSQFGLNLFDGYDVKIFNADPQNPKALYNNYIAAIFEDTDGTMWFSSGIGLSKYDRATQTFKNFKNGIKRLPTFIFNCSKRL